MKALNFELKNLCQRVNEGSFKTQRERHYVLQLSATLLDQLGFKRMNSTSLKLKHTQALFKYWHNKGISVGTIKNRMSHLRWWAKQVNKPGAIFKTNKQYYDSAGFEYQKRQYKATENKAKVLEPDDLKKITNEYTRMSLLLQKHFGLRREESIKFMPSYADRGDHIVLKGSWTKGGKKRIIVVRTDEQRQVLDAVKEMVRGGALIDPQKNYRQQQEIYDAQVQQAGLSKMHGLRHAYAQQRYFEITGWQCPIAGGPQAKDLTNEQKKVDKHARQIISKELGHERLQIVSSYIG